MRAFCQRQRASSVEMRWWVAIFWWISCALVVRVCTGFSLLRVWCAGANKVVYNSSLGHYNRIYQSLLRLPSR